MATQKSRVPIAVTLTDDPPCPPATQRALRRALAPPGPIGPPQTLVNLFESAILQVQADARRRGDASEAVVQMFLEPEERGAPRREARVREHVLEVLNKPRFGLKKADWDQTMKCITYHAYDAIKHTYGYRHFFDYRGQRGCVIEVDGESGDGDWNFNIGGINPQWKYNGKLWKTLHCEITPCDRPKLDAFLRELTKRWEKYKQGLGPQPHVILGGTVTWDAAHTNNPAVLEFHPVKEADFL